MQLFYEFRIQAEKSGPTWKASRFFITPEKCFRAENGGFDKRTHTLFICMIEFGKARNFENYEVFVDAVMMRILRICG
nr:acyl-homoserine-lactone synthase [Halomonas sp. ISL-56]